MIVTENRFLTTELLMKIMIQTIVDIVLCNQVSTNRLFSCLHVKSLFFREHKLCPSPGCKCTCSLLDMSLPLDGVAR